MRAGDLRHRITILSKVETSRSSGGVPVLSLVPLVTLDAAVEPISGREYTQLRAGMSSVTIRFRIRYRAGITADMRVSHAGRTFDIIEPPINVRNENRELVLMCTDSARPAS